MKTRVLAIGGVVAVAAALAWLLFVALPRRARSGVNTGAAAAAAPSPAPAAGRKIKARLFYVADDGQHLVRAERDVAYGDGTVEQAREILNAQIAPVGEPLVSAIPAGTVLRALFLTEKGEAYVDFSREIMTGHTGGTVDEILTVYSIVDALTDNLPAVTAVQVLVDGRQVDTLAGHIDLRAPLAKNLSVVLAPAAAATDR